MKKILFTLVAMSAAAAQVQAQEFYLKLGGGYALPLAGQSVNTDNNIPFSGSLNYDMTTGDLASFETRPVSFAAGGYGTFGAGLMLTENVGVELSMLAGLGMKKYSSTSTYPFYSKTYGNLSATEKYTLYANTPILVSPAIRLQTAGKTNLYTRIGALLPAKSDFKAKISATVTSPVYGSSSYSSELEYKTKMGLGFNGAIGVSAKTIEWLRVWAEVNFSAMSLHVKQRTYTSYTIDGRNVTNTIPADEAVVTYDNSGSGNTQPSFTLPFSSIGIMAGIAVVF